MKTIKKLTKYSFITKTTTNKINDLIDIINSQNSLLGFLLDSSNKKIVKLNPKSKGKFLIMFIPSWARNCGNDPLPAIVEPYIGPTSKHLKRLYVKWDNGFSCVVQPKNIIAFKIINK